MTGRFGNRDEHYESELPAIELARYKLMPFGSHLDAVRALAFHPTEMCLATGGDDCTVKIWRMDVAGLASTAYAQILILSGA